MNLGWDGTGLDTNNFNSVQTLPKYINTASSKSSESHGSLAVAVGLKRAPEAAPLTNAAMLGNSEQDSQL